MSPSASMLLGIKWSFPGALIGCLKSALSWFMHFTILSPLHSCSYNYWWISISFQKKANKPNEIQSNKKTSHKETNKQKPTKRHPKPLFLLKNPSFPAGNDPHWAVLRMAAGLPEPDGSCWRPWRSSHQPSILTFGRGWQIFFLSHLKMLQTTVVLFDGELEAD